MGTAIDLVDVELPTRSVFLVIRTSIFRQNVELFAKIRDANYFQTIF